MELREKNSKMKILDVVHTYFALQCQNGSLERNFAYKRRVEDRLAGKMTPKTLDERLRIRTSGKIPTEVYTIDRADTDHLHYDDLLIQVCHDVAPTQRSAPKKRQLDLAELAAVHAIGGRKKRLDDGGSHASYAPRPDHANAMITIDEAEALEHAIFDPDLVPELGAEPKDSAPITLDELDDL